MHMKPQQQGALGSSQSMGMGSAMGANMGPSMGSAMGPGMGPSVGAGVGPLNGVPSYTQAQSWTSACGPGEYPCPQCHRTYRWKGSLAQHLRLECGKEPQFQCPYCPHRTKHKGNLNIHILGRHAGKPGIPVRGPYSERRHFGATGTGGPGVPGPVQLLHQPVPGVPQQ